MWQGGRALFIWPCFVPFFITCFFNSIHFTNIPVRSITHTHILNAYVINIFNKNIYFNTFILSHYFGLRILKLQYHFHFHQIFLLYHSYCHYWCRSPVFHLILLWSIPVLTHGIWQEILAGRLSTEVYSHFLSISKVWHLKFIVLYGLRRKTLTYLI